jgi:regulator of replication initiation timing
MDIWIEEIRDWDTQSFSGGYAGLHDLADSSFSGAVSVDGTWALFVNGRVVSVVERGGAAGASEFTPADIEAFETGDGTAYRAPHPGVPLLIAMKVGDGDTRAKYYTEDTPIEQVDETLSDGGFTGYLELSENVLSGDYYTVYQAGRSMDIAFVGNARRLDTDEEAREAAHDEVGIYEVTAVDIDVTPIPEPEPEDDTTMAGGVASDPAAGEPDATSGSAGVDEPSAPATDSQTEPTEATADESSVDIGTAESVADSPATESVADQTGPDATEPTAPSDAGTKEMADVDGTEEAADADSATTTDAEPTTPDEPAPDSAQREGTPSTSQSGDPARRSGTDTSAGATPSSRSEPTTDDQSDGSTGAAAGSQATEQLASRSIPSLDPERTAAEDGSTPTTGNRRDRPGGRESAEQRSTPNTEPSSNGEMSDLRAELASVRESLQAAETDRDAAREELADLRATLEEVRAERAELAEERDDLRAEVERLRERVQELEADLDPAATRSGPSLSTAEAVEGTDLFVRYDSKGDTTVEDACTGSASPEELTANLRIDHHTRFEADGATVDGQPFEEWLHGSQRYRVAEWIVSRLVFEIRDTGSVNGLRALYEALPTIDRIELDGTVTVDGDDEQEVCEFDVVFRDRMGEPLLVADLDDARDPVSESQMATLIQDAIAVCAEAETFAAAFYVTAAFYDPDALETARDATGNSLLSRDSRLSFVKESRKRGFHLGLVESRDGGFHLSVPDL